jgi:hypothetical protein
MTSYTWRLLRIKNFFNELRKRTMFTCSGGNSNAGFDGATHICHRSFYLNNEKYTESILSQGIDNWDVSLFKRGNINLIKDRYIVKTDDLPRFLYVMRGHDDYWRHTIASTIVFLNELALCGEIDREYLNPELAETVALFLAVGFDCPMEFLLNTGSIHLPLLSTIRLLCNGAFQEISKTLVYAK